MSNLDKQEQLILVESLDAYCRNKPTEIRDEINNLRVKILNTNIIILDYDVQKVLHPTEQKYPEQCRRFVELHEEEYKTFLEKNSDYSSWNINATGLIGIVVRFWDKAARIMNLSGFNIGTGEFTGAKKNLVADETIIDTFKDAGVYAKIARIYAEGKWGK